VSEERLTIRSYRRVFRLERRIYRVDRWSLPVPGGLSLRALAYFLAALLCVLAGGAIPGVRSLLALLSPPVRYLVLPAGLAALATQAAPDERPLHHYALAWLAFRLRARRLAAGRAIPREGTRFLISGSLGIRACPTARRQRHRLACPARAVVTRVPGSRRAPTQQAADRGEAAEPRNDRRGGVRA
jgi:TcpE family